MQKRLSGEILEDLRLYGRTFWEPKGNILYFNWTCSGFAVTFQGTFLAARFRVIPGTVMRRIPGETPQSFATREEKEWPWLGLFMDDDPMPAKRFLLDQEDTSVVLFESDEPELHTIKVIRLTECARAVSGLVSFIAEGDLLKYKSSEKRKKIEFVGDSITCGFGNETYGGERDFYTSEENGWMACGAIAARKLQMEGDYICVSGITVGRFPQALMPYGMIELYPYTDRLTQDRVPESMDRETSYECWDFKGHVPDYIVINLGTNDGTMVGRSEDILAAERMFDTYYYKFLSMLRQYNGFKPQIICALGCIDYYLYDRITAVVQRFMQDTGDQKICCFKYTKMLMSGQDAGACYHPSIDRHMKMAEELAALIRSLEEKNK